MIIIKIIIMIMCTNEKQMVLRDQYNQLPMQNKLEFRDEYLRRSGMSLITFYQKLRTDNFKKLERELFEELFNNFNN